MTRASLGHTGRELCASAGTQTIYALVIAGAFARICASLEPDWSGTLLLASAVMWTAAFGGFALVYGPLLCSPVSARPNVDVR
jgi:uncharacterized protein involved in response to NO